MASVYDEVEIEDMTYIARLRTFYFPCPCGDKFFITLDDLLDGEDIAKCPSCSLIIRVVFDADELEERYGGEGEDEEVAEEEAAAAEEAAATAIVDNGTATAAAAAAARGAVMPAAAAVEVAS